MRNFTEWLTTPSDNHIVDFYESDNAMTSSLRDYVKTGLINDESCIVIAKPLHIQMLDNEMSKQTAEIKTKFRKYCRIQNAQLLLEDFMQRDLPDKKKFHKVMTNLLSESKKNRKPIRIYGEMVAILLEQQNAEGALQLEKLWNELAKDYSFSLYCAYPTNSHGLSDNELRTMIKSCHEFTFASLAYQ